MDNTSNVIYEENQVDKVLGQLSERFSDFHGYASLVVCIFGIFTNFFNISILTHRDMRTPTNTLLTWLAVSDILTMVPYLPFVVHFYCLHSPAAVDADKNTYGWAIYMLIMINLTATTHTVSIWLGVSLAVFRFIQMRTIRKPVARKSRLKHVKLVTSVVYVLSAIVLIPNYLTNEIESMRLPDNSTVYGIRLLKLATNETEPLVLANVLTYATIAKIIPCILMIIFGGSLLFSLSIKGRQRRRRLSTTSSNNKREAKQSKTTRMLLVVMILFLITELPQGILIFLSATMAGFFDRVYMPLGDLMDFIALVNNAINFVLYCIMSQQFRSKFIDIYFKRTSRLKDFEKFSLNHSVTKTVVTDCD